MLDIQNLKIKQDGNQSAPLLDISELKIEKGKIVFLIGESGAGKSLALSSIAGWKKRDLQYSGRIQICFEDSNPNYQYSLFELSHKQLSRFRRQHLGYIMQQPYAAFNPTMKLGKQIIEKRIDKSQSANERKKIELEVKHLLQALQLEEPDRMMQSYPYELSGGQLQRMAIALALQNQPELILADEPTSSLDGSNRKQVLELLIKTCRARNITLLISSHELAAVSEFSDELICLERGKIAYRGTSEYSSISDDYTRSFFDAYNEYITTSPSLSKIKKIELQNDKQLLISNLRYSYPSKNLIKNRVKSHVFSNFNISFRENCRVGILGASGSGKTTLAKIISGLAIPQEGSIQYKEKIFSKGIKDKNYPKIQMVFQDPYSSFNPIRSIFSQLKEVTTLNSRKSEKIFNLIRQFGLEKTMADRMPHQLSGGQLQRFAIIRVLLSEPEGLIMDEFVTGLDIHWKIKIIQEVKSYLMSQPMNIWVISHEEHLLKHLCTEIFTLNKGQLEFFT